MFAPTRTWRRWHRKINLNQRRYAVASSLAASAVPALVFARGHRIGQVKEIPLVIDTAAIDPLKKTKQAKALLEALKVTPELERTETAHKRTGKSRLRNRPKTNRVGPLIVTATKNSTAYLAFRNLRGVQVTNVFNLNLLKLAPGGHLGRFIIWTRDAFEKLDAIFGTDKQASKLKKDYRLPRTIMDNPDVRRVAQADTIQQVVKRARREVAHRIKPNYLRNHKAMHRLNPYRIKAHRSALYHTRVGRFVKREKQRAHVRKTITKQKAAKDKAAKDKQEGKVPEKRDPKKRSHKSAPPNWHRYAKFNNIVFGTPIPKIVPKKQRGKREKKEKK